MNNLFIIIIVYFLAVFGVSRLFIPHLSFRKSLLPNKLPQDMELKISELKKLSGGDRSKFLELAYEFLGSKYHSERLATLTKFSYLFKSMENVWNHSGFTPCTQSNFLMRIFLVKSGLFSEDDIKLKHVFVNFVPHQYLKVNVNENWIDVDVGEKQRGLLLGKHLKYFG